MKNLILFIVTIFSLHTFQAKDFHPYHVGTVEYVYNPETKKFEITAKFFVEDFESALNTSFNKSFRLDKKKMKEENNQSIKIYVEEFILLRADNVPTKLEFLGYEIEKESIYIYLESTAVPTPKSVEADVMALYEAFNDQQNIVHITVNGVRKSQKLNYPQIQYIADF